MQISCINFVYCRIYRMTKSVKALLTILRTSISEHVVIALENKSVFNLVKHYDTINKHIYMAWLNHSYTTQLPQSLYSVQAPEPVSNPEMVLYNSALADELGIAEHLKEEQKRRSTKCTVLAYVCTQHLFLVTMRIL